jgi:hypothetical protein
VTVRVSHVRPAGQRVREWYRSGPPECLTAARGVPWPGLSGLGRYCVRAFAYWVGPNLLVTAIISSNGYRDG